MDEGDKRIEVKQDSQEEQVVSIKGGYIDVDSMKAKIEQP